LIHVFVAMSRSQTRKTSLFDDTWAQHRGQLIDLTARFDLH
jgi:hypothetical protein